MVLDGLTFAVWIELVPMFLLIIGAWFTMVLLFTAYCLFLPRHTTHYEISNNIDNRNSSGLELSLDELYDHLKLDHEPTKGRVIPPSNITGPTTSE